MKRTPLILLCLFSLLPAACGGGGGNNLTPSGGAAGGTATPSPTPLPTMIPGPASALSGPRQYNSHWWGPPAVAQDLDFPVQHGYDGSGQSVAVVIDSNVNTFDVNAFLQYFQIPATGRSITTISVDGASGLVNAEQGEATLDVETIAGLAPGANVMLYQVPDLGDQSVIDAYNQILADHKAYVVNSSWGGCEAPADPGVVGTQGVDSIIAAGAQKGVAFVAAAGDEGNECFTGGTPQYKVGADWPASNPNVIAAGGTQTDGSAGELLTAPVVWNDNNGAGSGGVSGQYAIPAYQTPALLANCMSAASGGSPCSSTKRNVPDISMPAGGAAAELNGVWQDFVGTSWSSPEYAALMAELYEYCNAAAGVANPVTIPYYAYNRYHSVFIDVIGGNDRYASTTPFYSAGAGFDDASGLGVPLGASLAQAWCPNRAPASNAAARSSSMGVSRSAQYPAQDRTLDVTPRVRGLTDEGARSASQQTRIQFVVVPDENAANSEARIVAALQNAGFAIVQRFSNHLVVDAVAPAELVNRFFRTSLHDVVQARYGARYMPATQIVVPAAIAPYVSGVSLDDVVKFHTARE